jgi:transposase-like protein
VRRRPSASPRSSPSRVEERRQVALAHRIGRRVEPVGELLEADHGQRDWPKLRSSNPLERFNRELGRRTDVVGIFSDDAPEIRLVPMLAIEANDEWLVGRAYVSHRSMATLFEPRTDHLSHPDPEEVTELLAA